MGAPRYFEEFQVGEEIKSRGRFVEACDVKIFSGCTSLTARIFTDPMYCEKIDKVRTPPIPSALLLNIVDGFFAMDVSPDEVPILHYGYDRVRFTKLVYPGDCVYTNFKLLNTGVKNDAFGVLTWQASTFNQNGELVSVHIDKLYVGRMPVV